MPNAARRQPDKKMPPGLSRWQHCGEDFDIRPSCFFRSSFPVNATLPLMLAATALVFTSCHCWLHSCWWIGGRQP